MDKGRRLLGGRASSKKDLRDDTSDDTLVVSSPREWEKGAVVGGAEGSGAASDAATNAMSGDELCPASPTLDVVDSAGDAAGVATASALKTLLAGDVDLSDNYADNDAGAETESPVVAAKAVPRRAIAREILTTETTYVESMRLLKVVFETPLREAITAGKPIVSDDELRTMFAHLDPILAYNSILLEKLQSSVGGDAFDPQATLLGPIFLELSFFLKTYSLYVNNFAQASELITKLARKKARFKDFLAQCRLDPRLLSKTLMDFLIMPIQRIPRYSLLLADLLRHTPADHPDHKPLSSALLRINEVALHINENKASQDDFVLISQLQAQLQDTPWNLTLGKRKLIREEGVSLVSQPGADAGMGVPAVEAARMFLFSDCLFFATKTRAKKLAVRKWYWLQEVLPLDAALLAVPDVSDRCIGVGIDVEALHKRAEDMAALAAAADGESSSSSSASLAASALDSTAEDTRLSFVVASLTAQGLVKRQVRVLGTATVRELVDEFAELAGGTFDPRRCKLLNKGEAMGDAAPLSSFNLAPTDVLHLVPDAQSEMALPALPTSSGPRTSRLQLHVDTIKDVVKANPHSRVLTANAIFFAPDLDRDEMEYLLKQVAERVTYSRQNPANIAKRQTVKPRDNGTAATATAPGVDSDGDAGAGAAPNDEASPASFSASGFLSSVFNKIGSPSLSHSARRNTTRIGREDVGMALVSDEASPSRFSASSGSLPMRKSVLVKASEPSPAAVEVPVAAVDDEAAMAEAARVTLREYAALKPVPRPPSLAASPAASPGLQRNKGKSPPPLPPPPPKKAVPAAGGTDGTATVENPAVQHASEPSIPSDAPDDATPPAAAKRPPVAPGPKPTLPCGSPGFPKRASPASAKLDASGSPSTAKRVGAKGPASLEGSPATTKRVPPPPPPSATDATAATGAAQSPTVAKRVPPPLKATDHDAASKAQAPAPPGPSAAVDTALARTSGASELSVGSPSVKKRVAQGVFVAQQTGGGGDASPTVARPIKLPGESPLKASMAKFQQLDTPSGAASPGLARKSVKLSGAEPGPHAPPKVGTTGPKRAGAPLPPPPGGKEQIVDK